ncbi:MAG TPA: hypothetical protein VIL04_03880 [Solirubrobacterales bacterium]
MLDLNVYRVAFAPLAAALVILAFSLDGAPEPVDPGPVTATFDSAAAAATARQLARQLPDRSPGSDGDLAAADLVEERFAQIPAGRVLEQNFTAEVGGEDRELRNVVLVLPGATDEAVLVIAGRDARVGPGTASSAAATGVLTELAVALGASERERTLILASTDGASEGAAGAHELLRALPERFTPQAAVVIAQPGAAPSPPHVLAGSTGAERPPARLIATAAAMVEAQAGADPGLGAALGQLARLALPASLGEGAALTADGLGAVTISAAGELPLDPALDTREHLDEESIDNFGRAALATVQALASVPDAGAGGPSAYLRAGDNIVPGWALGLIALALLIPPGALALTALARAARDGTAQTALAWTAAWVAPALAALAALYLLTLVGLVPTPSFPFDPATLTIGVDEALALLFLCAVAAAAALFGPGLHLPQGPTRETLAAAAGAVAVGAALVAWLANPFLALLLAPLTHLVAVHALRAPLSQLAVAALALLAAIPFAAALLHVASALGWGLDAPWELAVLTASGQIGVVEAAATLALLGATLASVLAAARRPQARGARVSREPRGF